MAGMRMMRSKSVRKFVMKLDCLVSKGNEQRHETKGKKRKKETTERNKERERDRMSIRTEISDSIFLLCVFFLLEFSVQKVCNHLIVAYNHIQIIICLLDFPRFKAITAQELPIFLRSTACRSTRIRGSDRRESAGE